MASGQAKTRDLTTHQGIGLPEGDARTFLDATSDGVWEDDLQQGISHLSESWLQSLGYTTGDFPQPGTPSAWFSVVHPDDLAVTRAAYEQHLSGETPHYRQELRLRAANGSWRWMLSRGRVVEYAPDGRPLRVLGTHIDISEQKELAEQLVASRLRNELLLKAVPDLLFVQDYDGNIIDCSAPRPEHLVAPAEQLLGRNVREVLPLELADSLLACIRRAIDKQEMQTFTYSRRTDDSDLHFEARVTPHGLGLACCIVRDITAPRLMAQRLAEAQANYERLVRSLPVGVFSFRLGQDGDIRSAFISPRLEEVVCQPAELLACGADGFHQFIHPDDLGRAYDIVTTLLEEDARVQEEIRCVGRDGQVIWVGLEIQSTRAPGTELLIHGTASDISAQKRSEEEHRQLQVRLQRSERMRSLGQLAGGVAHEFNNQLANVLFFVDSLKKDRLSREQLSRYADMLHTGARRTADLTQKLLDFSRHGSPKREVFDLHHVLRESLAMLDPTLGSRIRVLRMLQADCSMVLGDPSQISSSLLNLALNARDAMSGHGAITVATECLYLDAAQCLQLLHEGELSPGTYIRLSVSDTGTGMDAKTRERIFEPFFTTKPMGKGTGLGLAAVYGTVNDHTGAIEVESRPGHGTTFNIFLPVCTAPAKATALPPPEPIRGTGHLLLVDDETLLRILLRDMLRDLGYRVTDCETGRDAVRVLTQSPDTVDVAILDVAMPGMGGLDTYRALRQIRPDLPALAISGFGNHPDVHTMLREGASGLIPKPVDMSQLSRKLAELLGIDTECS